MKEFLDKVKALWEQKHQVDLLKEQLEVATKKLEGMKFESMKIMETLELDKQHLPGYGTIYRQTNFSVKVPKDPEEKKKLFEWIAIHKGEDVLENMISIHSATLNSFYENELELAKQAGNVGFKIPGIGEPEAYYKLGMRKS